MVSVVIPCYNQARFLREAIESVLAQTCGRSEIVVVNDGSTDNTVSVANAYSGVECVSHRNQGRSVARNAGLARVKSDYVVFLDADDRLLPKAFETGLDHFAAHPYAAFVAGRCVKLSEDGIQRNTHYPPVVEHNHYLRLLIGNYIWMPGTVMFRTSILREVGGFDFDPGITGSEDYQLYLRITRRHRIACHDQVVAEYRQHDSSTSRDSMLMIRSTLSVLYAQRDAVKGDPRARRVLRQGIRNWQNFYGDQLVSAAREQLRARKWKRAIPSLVGLLRYHPAGFAHHAFRKVSRIALGYRPESLDAID